MYTIYFDMDGTIANLYGVENWLPKLRAEDASPYAEATPLTDMENLQLLLAILQNRGYKIGIISWLAKNSSKSYDKSVRKAKIEWLRAMLPEIHFDEMHIVKYGTRKDYVEKIKKELSSMRQMKKLMNYKIRTIFVLSSIFSRFLTIYLSKYL